MVNSELSELEPSTTMTTMISQPLYKRPSLLASLAAIAAIGVALSVHATYSGTSSDDDVKDSCKDFSVNSSGLMSASCNTWGSHGDVFDVRTRDIDLDDKVGYDDGALHYNQKDFSGDCEDLSVNLANDKLTLKAVCSDTTISIRIDDMMWNAGGEYPTSNTPAGGVGLYWRSSRWSD